MSGLPEEYGDIENRRYHAQPDCCPVCGPAVYFLDSAGERRREIPSAWPRRCSLRRYPGREGNRRIHLACDAGNAGAVERLRRIKHREAKRWLSCVLPSGSGAVLPDQRGGETILESPRRPIVLCEKKQPDSLRELSGNSRLGVMLPYTPLHVLLLDGAFGGPKTLVMTSANAPDCPVLTENEEALSLLKGQIDGFLLHNRPIENRCDDSLVMECQGREYFFRRSRGYAPQPVPLEQDGTGILALGAQQKASFALGQGKKAFLSQHIGDLDSLKPRTSFGKIFRGLPACFTFGQAFLPAICIRDMNPQK